MNLFKKAKITHLIILGLSVVVLASCSLLSMYPENSDADQSLRPKEGTNGKFGYVDRSGNFVIPPKFDSAVYFSNSKGTAQVNYHGKECYINREGEVVPDAESQK